MHFPADSLLWAQRLPHYHAAPAITAGTSNPENTRRKTRMSMVTRRFRRGWRGAEGTSKPPSKGKTSGKAEETKPVLFSRKRLIQALARTGASLPSSHTHPPTTPGRQFPKYAPTLRSLRAGGETPESIAQRKRITAAFMAGPVTACLG